MIHHEINCKNPELDYLYYKAENGYYENKEFEDSLYNYYCTLCKWPDIKERVMSGCYDACGVDYPCPYVNEKSSKQHLRSKNHIFNIENEYIINEQKKQYI